MVGVLRSSSFSFLKKIQIKQKHPKHNSQKNTAPSPTPPKIDGFNILHMVYLKIKTVNYFQKEIKIKGVGGSIFYCNFAPFQGEIKNT